jgi:RNA polymerase sigma-70 factor (ECF subfamily)
MPLAQIQLAEPPTEADTTVFETVRPRLLGIAGRVLGGTAEADDVVQEAWLRWQRTDRSAVRDPEAFLVTVTRRLALNVAQSARARHETAMPPWLPAAIDVDADADPALRAERDDVVESGLRLLSERLTASERGAYVLREAFDYPYREISRVLGLSEANARQLVNRARTRVDRDRRGGDAAPAEPRDLLEAFFAAASAGDLDRLERLLASAQMERPRPGARHRQRVSALALAS